ncbi:MAG: hypothetical protein IJW43_05105 [Clostridia bacterium]|nr:hypothetical protein [Clostridia bacterium]
MNSKVRVVLPDSYDLVVGDTFQLFYRGVVEAPNPYCYSIVATCEKGKNFPRYFEFTPKEVGEYLLDISVYDAEQNLLGGAKTLLKVVEPKAPKKPVNVLVLGDSLTCHGDWVSEVSRRIKSKDGEPKGLGFDGINFVGNCKNGDVGFEAFGGWYWVSFMSGKSNAIWVEAPNKLVVGDQHAVWKDIDGNLWQLETLQVDYLKFKRYGDNTAEKPAGDTLYPFKNNVTQTPIKFYSSSSESVSPFFDNESKEIDVKKYLERSNIDGIDAVYVLLGVNGIMRTIAFTLSWKEYCKVVVKEAKELIAKLREVNPNLKVKILSPVLPSCKGGMGWNYGAEPPFNDYYDIVDYIMELCIAYKDWCNEPDSKEYMEYVNLTGQFDSENAYPSIQKPVNVRSTKTEEFEVNGFHPTSIGQMQIADAVFRNVVKEFCS